jgi:hypothetical protein
LEFIVETIGTLYDAEAKVLNDARLLLSELSRLGAANPQSAEEAVGTLARVRDTAYENLNQIQHEYLILAAVRHLVDKSLVSPDVEWQWNPRQTGGINEPDLRGARGGTVVVSVEVTTSVRPIGTILTRMQGTLKKLSGESFAGGKYYVVRTDAMERKARSIVKREGYTITVIRLPLNDAL